jgi:hypothetical protein
MKADGALCVKIFPTPVGRRTVRTSMGRDTSIAAIPPSNHLPKDPNTLVPALSLDPEVLHTQAESSVRAAWFRLRYRAATLPLRLHARTLFRPAPTRTVKHCGTTISLAD